MILAYLLLRIMFLMQYKKVLPQLKTFLRKRVDFSVGGEEEQVAAKKHQDIILRIHVGKTALMVCVQTQGKV